MSTFHPKAERAKLRRGWKTDQLHDLELTVIETEEHRSMYSDLITMSPFYSFPEICLLMQMDNQDESTPGKATPEEDPEREPLPPIHDEGTPPPHNEPLLSGKVSLQGLGGDTYMVEIPASWP